MSRVIIRAFNRSIDESFIFSSWQKNVYYSKVRSGIDVHKEEFFRQYNEYITEQLAQSQVTIACLDGDPDTILGYSVIDKGVLEWIYVKVDFRNHGIASLLLKNKHIHDINTDNLTKIGTAILNEHPNLYKKKEKIDDRISLETH